MTPLERWRESEKLWTQYLEQFRFNLPHAVGRRGPLRSLSSLACIDQIQALRLKVSAPTHGAPISLRQIKSKML